MKRAQLVLLLTLLKMYRAYFTWSHRQDRAGHDRYRHHADVVIHDIRFALDNGGFYNDHNSMLKD